MRPSLKFPDNSFDIVFAPYFISCVPDPLAVTREMRRVCKPGGRLVFLNHFLSDRPITSKLERAIAPLTVHLGFKSDFDLPGIPRADRIARGVDREGQRAADLVAGDLSNAE